MKTKNLPLLLFWLLAGVLPLQAQTLEEEVRAMRAEIQRLRQEVETLRQEVRGSPQEPSPAEILPVLQAQVQEHAQTKVESASKFPVKLFGTIVSQTAWNSGEPNWLDLPNIAGPRRTGEPSGTFISTMRQSRVGLMLDGPTIGSMKLNGLYTMDFFGGIPNFSTGQVMGLPRMLYAYARLDGEKSAFQIGQDNMILAPNNPTSLGAQAFPLMFRSGNLYFRVPQIRAERVLASSEGGEFHAIAGIIAPVAGDFVAPQAVNYQFVPPPLAGERSRMPGVQARLVWRALSADPYEKPKWELGASGHYSRERFVTTVSSWAGAVDFNATLGRFGTGGELFVGRNIDAFGGSVGQNAQSHGGFIEGRVTATRRFSLNGGFGTDRLYHLARFPAGITRNSSAFGNAIYSLTPEFSTSLEYRWLKTRVPLPDRRLNHQLNLIFAYSF